MNPEVWQRISSATTSCCSTVLIFPPTGAGAPAFQSMSVLEGDTTVWGYCPPGRGQRLLEPGIRTIGEFVSKFRSSFDIPTGPLILAGVSFGAMLSFVAANILENDGIFATRLVALCGQSPKSYRGERERWNLERARQRMRSYGLTPKSILNSDESDDLFVRPTLDDLLLAESCCGNQLKQIHVPITCVSAIDDKIVSSEEAVQWREATSETYRLIEVTGGHYAHEGFGRREWLNVFS